MAQSAHPPIAIIPNLVQGVSQQAIQNRRDTQCEAQRNCINSVLEGVVARPHANLVKLYAAAVFTNAHFGETSHGVTENYVTVVRQDGAIQAFDLSDGTECSITFDVAPQPYLGSGGGLARDRLRTQVVDDYSFIANRNVAPAMLSTTSPAATRDALVFVKATTFLTHYVLKVSGPGGTVVVDHKTDATDVDPTADIANVLMLGINGVSGYTAVRTGSSIHIYRADGQDFAVETADGNGDTYMLAFKGTAPRFSDLPARAFDGMVLKVRGDPVSASDDFYVKYVGDYSTGNWVEVVGPGTKTTLNYTTMPHVLICTGFRTFQYKEPAWSTRIAGDEATAKDPGFVGKSIRDMVYHQRRLGIIWQAGADFSKTGFPFTFFADTVQTVLATAPVDLTVSSGDKRGAAVLDFALQAQESLYLWAQRVQWRVSSGNNPFKQDTVEVLPSMSYQYAPNAYPLTLGGFIILAADSGAYSSLRALQFAQTKLSGDVDITSHVGQYMASGVREMTASDTLRYIFVQSDGDQSVIYLFNYTYDSQQGFIQTALNTWDIPGGQVLWASLKDNTLRMLQQRPEGVAYCTFDLTPLAVDPVAGAQYTTRLDFRVNETQVASLNYTPSSDTSRFVLPYSPTGSQELMVIIRADGGTGRYSRGRAFKVLSVTGPEVIVQGDLTSYQFYVGQRITAIREESEFQVRGDKGALPVDRLDINRFFLTLANTAYTRIEVQGANKPLKTYEFTGRVLGSEARTGAPIPQNGSLQAPVGENAGNVKIRLINDSFLPSYWQSAAYSYTAVGWGGQQ